MTKVPVKLNPKLEVEVKIISLINGKNPIIEQMSVLYFLKISNPV